MIERVFRNTDANSILSGYFEGNPASRRVLEKLGFQEVDRYPYYCTAREHDMPNVDMRLYREVWENDLGGQPGPSTIGGAA